ncbi:MAG: type II toxin-antitoxin system RelE/ParE family toxin [Chthonomonadales bacterium]
MKIQFESASFKFIEDLDAKQCRQVIRKVFALARNPTPGDSKKIVGNHYLRADVGEYRIIYRFDADTVYVVLIGKRNDDEVYKILSRL